MKHLTGKLAFVHRTLWTRDLAYRWSVLLGPPPLLGIAAAAIIMVAVQWMSGPRGQDRPPPWAHVTPRADREGQPFAEPTAALPQKDANGRYQGFEPGWHGVVQPLSIDATMTSTLGQAQGSFALSEPTIPLSRIVDAGPPTGLFAGTVNAWFVVQTAGIYTFSAQLVRSGTQSANCIVWLETPKHHMFRSFNLNTGGQAVLNFEATAYKLEPGLLHLILATGCWRGDHMIGAGEVTVTVRRPGQPGFQALTSGDLISAVRK